MVTIISHLILKYIIGVLSEIHLDSVITFVASLQQVVHCISALIQCES